MIAVTTPTFTLSNEPSARTDAYLVDLPGWYDSTDTKMFNNQRNGAHGDFDQEPVYDDARYFSIVGRIIAGEPSPMFALRQTIMQLKNIQTAWDATVDDIDGAWSASVRIAGKIRFQILDELAGYAEFEIPLKAKDPRKYGSYTPMSTGLPTTGGGIAFPIVFPIDFGTPGATGRIATFNDGDAETYTQLEVTGGLAGGFSAVCTELGREIRFERQIPLGSTVAVDLRTGQAFIDGQSPVSGFFTRREWWTNPPGEFRTIQFNSIGAVTGTPTLTAHVPPAKN